MKLFKNSLFLVCLFLSCSFLHAQKELNGRVIDAQSKEAIPFVQVFIPNSSIGTLSDENGNFSLELPNSITSDSFSVFVLGYQRREMALKTYANNSTIELSVITYQLDQVEVLRKRCKKIKSYIWGTSSNTGLGLYYVGLGAQVAVYFENPKKNDGQINSISFFVVSDGVPDTRFRARIYRADGPNGAPGTDLLTKNMLLSAQNGNEWVNLDLEEYNLELPKEGFFVAMEWLPENTEKVPAGKGHISGQVLGAILEPAKNNDITWSKGFMGGWQQYKKNEGQKNTQTAMIKASLELCIEKK